MEYEIIKPERHQNLTKPREYVKEEEITYFSKDYIKECLNKIPPGRDKIMFEFLWRTGVRVSECINVRKKDLDFENDLIRIRWLKNRKYQNRYIPIPKSLKVALYSYSAGFLSDQEIFKMSRENVFHRAKKHGFGHPHKIRHSYAMNFMHQSKNPKAVLVLKELLGHTHLKSTLVYARVSGHDLKMGIEDIDFD